MSAKAQSRSLFKSNVIEITDTEEEKSFITENKCGVIFFGAEHCGHCITMISVIDQLCQKYPTVAFAHVETTRVKCAMITGTPVFVIYKNGKPLVEPVLGADPDGLTRMITTKLL
jgi:thiol-disulfide isomerase/thioredoxin